ncbi:MAG: hypothetical protein D3906_04210 [Candidatus Electrothrix sp. AUS1_2]|nr:hypothetical protein [Candidatus Electrothrix sp. AUS1_2]
MREIINAILYVEHTGRRRAVIPHDFPPWHSVYCRFDKWRKDRTWFLIHQILRQQLREHVGKEPEPTAAIIDSQSVRTSELADTRGFDGDRKVNGRKRHVVSDTLGFPLAVKVHDANLSDGKEAFDLLESLFFRFISIQVLRIGATWPCGSLPLINAGRRLPRHLRGGDFRLSLNAGSLSGPSDGCNGQGGSVLTMRFTLIQLKLWCIRHLLKLC